MVVKFFSKLSDKILKFVKSISLTYFKGNNFTFNIAGVLLASIRAHKGGCFVSARDSRGLLQTVIIVLAVVGSFV